MKRTSLTTAVIAGIAGVAGISNMASAVYLNNDGLGQALIYPYYTVNGGNNTLLTVVNTTSQGKAVKVRFLEAYDSREVLDFNLYLSPQDVWTGAVIPTGAGGAALFTPDNSCTVPVVPGDAADAVKFSTYAFAAQGSTQTGGYVYSDGGPTGVSRTLEGYVELIELGTVTNGGHGANATRNTLTAITHNKSGPNTGIPANCGQVVAAWSSTGYWATGDAQVDISAASGGLFGSGAIINGAEGTIAGYNADAIDQFYNAGDNAGTQNVANLAPGTILPNLATGTSAVSYVFAASTLATAATPTTPTLVTSTFARTVDAVSSIFMADTIYNEYWTGGTTATSSEWVITMPTKHFYVDAGTSPYLTTASTAALPPFDVLFSSAYGGTSCSPITPSFWDREELTPVAGGSAAQFSPPPLAGAGPQPLLCAEAQVISFNQSGVKQGGTPTTILGSQIASNIDTTGAGAYPKIVNGWAQIVLTSPAAPAAQNHLLVSGNGNVFYGLPVTGFWVTNSINTNVNGSGALGNYSVLFRHKLHRFCQTAATGGVCN